MAHQARFSALARAREGGLRRVIRLGAGVAAIGVLSAVLPGGCGGNKAASSAPRPTLKDEGQRVFGNAPPSTAPTPGSETGPGGGAPSPKAAPGAPARGGNWTIALAAFRAKGADGEPANAANAQAANIALARIRAEGQLPDAYVEQRGPAWVVVYGKYSGPADPRAKPDLERLQAIQVGGEFPYAFAFLSPPRDDRTGTSDYDLKRARALFGAGAVYTLQVGWYGREDLTRPTETDLVEARRAAERAAAILRAEGELAFFYHGPTTSSVTVGVFDASDFQAAMSTKDGSVSLDPMIAPQQSARLLEARTRHPLNLYNGAGYKIKTKTMREGKLVPSTLVSIPK